MKYKQVQLRMTFRDKRVSNFLKRFPTWKRGFIVEGALAYCLANPKAKAFDVVFGGAGIFKPSATPSSFVLPTRPRAIPASGDEPADRAFVNTGGHAAKPGSVVSAGGGAEEVDPIDAFKMQAEQRRANVQKG